MFKVGIIGLGAIGQRLIKSFTEHPEMEITAVCDPLEELLNSTVAAIGKAKGFTDYKEMLKNADIDLVYVAVPPKFHHQIVTDCVLEQKHILCEKPLANSVEEAESLYKQAADAGIIHAMNFPLNYSSGNATFASYIKEGYIGKLRRLELKMHFPNGREHGSKIIGLEAENKADLCWRLASIGFSKSKRFSDPFNWSIATFPFRKTKIFQKTAFSLSSSWKTEHLSLLTE